MSKPDTVHDREILPTNVKPVHYDVTLDLDLGELPYKGRVSIELDVVETTKSISLNSLDLDITDATIESPSSTARGLQVSSDAEKQTITINLEESITSGSKAFLILSFTGNLRTGTFGLIDGRYKDKDGLTKHLIWSDLEPTKARSVLPCFDEPALKATFSVTLVNNKDVTCLCNMPEIASKAVGDGKKSTTFGNTPPMSTYLLSFAVGEMDMIETESFRIPVRIYATPNNDIESGRFALELAAKTLSFFEDKFGVPFPLPKMDLIAVPDFPGAMENWGLVTFKEIFLLHDQVSGTLAQKRLLSDVVQHELAHQWFGNLVTMDFWDGLWLNEGFATWVAVYGNDVFFPDWKVKRHFLVGQFTDALNLDSLRNSHPVEVPVKNANDIGQVFDDISYAKGCCVIQMIAEHLGEDVFLEGVKRYIIKHQYGNTSTADLWEALSQTSGIDVAKIMGNWTLHVGHPVVVVTEEEGSIHLKQTRFLRTGDVQPEEDQTLYPVPLAIHNADGTRNNVLFETREIALPIGPEFVKLNSSHVGFYRTAYSSKRLAALGDQKDKLAVEDRIGIIADAVAIAPAGYQLTSDVLSLLENFQDENDLFVWKGVLAALDTIRTAWMFEDQATRDGLRTFQRKIVSRKLHELGWDLGKSNDEAEQELKALLFGAAALAGDVEAAKAAANMFEKYTSGDRTAIHPELRNAVFAAVLAHSDGSQEYDAVVKEFRTATTGSQRQVALTALGISTNPELIERTLALLLTDEVKQEDFTLALEEVIKSSAGLVAAWEWLRANVDAISAKVASGLSAFLGEVVSLCGSNFSSEKQAQEFRSFWAGRDTKEFDQSVAQCLDEIQVKIRWLENGRSDVRKWLGDQSLI